MQVTVGARAVVLGLCCLLLSSVRGVRQCDAEILSLPFDESRYKVYHVPGMNADFYVDPEAPGDILKIDIMAGKTWEKEIRELVLKYTKEGSVAVDVGSHIGTHTIEMSRAVGPTGTVHSFEPQKRLCAEQLRNLRINGCDNVFLHRKALGECARKILLGRPPLHEGGCFVLRGGENREGIEVDDEGADMVTLDSLNLENVSLIKADIEFYEYFMFKGGRETIQRCRPVIVFELLTAPQLEVSIKNLSKDVAEHALNSKKLLKSYGYTVKKIDIANYIGFPTEKMAQLKEEASKKSTGYSPKRHRQKRGTKRRREQARKK